MRFYEFKPVKPPTPQQQRVRSLQQQIENGERLWQQSEIGSAEQESWRGSARQLLFKTTTGYQPRRMDGTFRRLLRDCGLEVGAEGQKRSLYCLRHTYATLELLTSGIDIHTLARQMGNSVAMIELHYSKLTATMAANRLV